MENHKEKLTISIEEYWQRDLPKVNEREIELKLKSDLINDVIGPRRSGKTYLMFFTMKDDDLYPTGCFWSVSKGIKLGSVLVGLLIAIVRIISVRKDTKGLVNINVMTTERFIDESENKEKFKDIPLFINYFYI